jgi:hypothetical protein
MGSHTANVQHGHQPVSTGSTAVTAAGGATPKATSIDFPVPAGRSALWRDDSTMDRMTGAAGAPGRRLPGLIPRDISGIRAVGPTASVADVVPDKRGQAVERPRHPTVYIAVFAIWMISLRRLLSALGGLAGVVLGLAVTAGYAATQRWPTSVPLTAFAGGVGATVMVGAIAGLYPAVRAARLAPTEALATP